MKITSYRNNIKSESVFEKGRLKEYKETECRRDSGTEVAFVLDKEIFPDNTLPVKSIREQIKLLSFLTSGIKFGLEVDGAREEYYSEEGIKDLLASKVTDPITNPFYIRKEVDIYDIEIALQYTKASNEKIFAFTNNIPNPDGGTHVTGLKTGLTHLLNKIAKEQNLIQESLDGDLLRKGLVAAVSVKMKATPQFYGQTKSKLTTSEVRGKVQSVIGQLFLTKKDISEIVEKALLENKAEKAAERARQAVKEITSGSKNSRMINNLPSKLSDATGNGYRELFLVEGK